MGGGFMEGSVVGEKVFGGKVFPKTLLPPNTCESHTCDLAEMVRADRARLTDALEQHGAILLRGFGVNSAEEFAGVVDAFGWEEFPYKGAADRIRIADRVFTANEAPLKVFIPFHHEMALIKEFPSKVFFACLQPSPEGGQTAIVRSDVVVERMEEEVPHVIEKLVGVGMRMVLHTKASLRGDGDSGKVWVRMLKTEDMVEAEKRALENLACNSVKFNNDGTADFTYGPMNPIKEFGGKRIWFNTLLGYTTDERDAYISFDGSPLPTEAADAYENILEENSVDVSWQKGDVLLLDNLAVQHARRPGKPPRAVVVSLC